MMEQTTIPAEDEVLHQIDSINRQSGDRNIRRILVLFEPKSLFIGDTLIKLSYLRSIHAYWQAPAIDVNSNHPTAKELFCNNPFIDRFFCSDWEDIDFLGYDLIISISNREKAFLGFLARRYAAAFAGRTFTTSVYSFSGIHFKEDQYEGQVFPAPQSYFDFLDGYSRNAPIEGNEIYVSPEEKKWGEAWLAERGVGPGERVVVVLDSTTHHDKLLRVDVYFEIVGYFLSLPKTKVVVFDEKNIGKEDFYRAYFDYSEVTQNFLFCNGLSLRKALCILSSDPVKVIFGPSSGLLHCASGIYNIFRHQGKPAAEIPVMIAYACKYQIKQEEWNWWGKSLVDCLLITQTDAGTNRIELLKGPGQACTTCDKYTADLFISYLGRRYGDRFNAPGIV